MRISTFLRSLIPLAAGAGGLVSLAAAPPPAPLPLEQSEVVEAINDVSRIHMPAGEITSAVVHSQLQAPDRLRTGRDSRAELLAADGTITRLGANTLFAYDSASRSLQLDRGSLLFHSPTDRGGGTIRSLSASATVLGTTIIAAATPDGGFKLLVLEGRAAVDFAAGAHRELTAGQMIFVRPGGLGTGTPGPTLNFDLARQVKASRLIHGFSRPLTSQPKIDHAIEKQQRAVGQGRFTATGFLVYAATSDTQVNGIEAAGPDADDNLIGEFNTHQHLALNSSETITTSTLPEHRVFRAPFLVPASESEFLHLESDTLLTGLLGLRIEIATPTLSFANAGMSAFNLIAKDTLTFTGSTTFTNLDGVDFLRLFAPLVEIPAGSAISADFSAATVSTFYIDTDATLHLAGGTINNVTGGLLLQSHSGDLIIDQQQLHAGGPIAASTVIPSSLNLDAPLGTLTLTSSQLIAQGGAFAALATNLTFTDTHFDLGGDFWTDSGDTTRLTRLTWQTTAPAAVFQSTAVNLIEAQALRFDGFATINLGARTIALTDVHFPAGAQVRLVSELGLLAPSPNTDQPVQPGLVNFVRDVSYADAPAQDYVPVAQGGTGLAPPMISISPPSN